MANDLVNISDFVAAALERERTPDSDALSLQGRIFYLLKDEETGIIKAQGEAKNLITAVGQQMYAERANGITTVAAPTGMQLGTGVTAAALTGAGAAIVTYITGSNAAFASGPTSAANGNARNITWTATYAAGVATATGIAEVVIMNQAAATNSAAAAANTISRALFGTAFDKAAGDSLTVTYVHTIGTV